MNTITRTGHAASNFVAVVNESYWRSLTDAQRGLLLAAAQIADKEAADSLVTFEDAAYVEHEQKGVKVTSLSRRQLQLWCACSSDVLTNFMAKAGAAAEELVAAHARLVQNPCCNSVSTHEPDE
jgi:TRAP-type C4-dicarboxylate transport system substrate-binding protein